jgi:hypothetical protein
MRTDEQRMRERELRRLVEATRRQGVTATTRSGRALAGVLRALSSALGRTADALDASSAGLDHEGRVADRI